MQKSFSASVIHFLMVFFILLLGSFIVLGSFLVDMQIIAINLLLQHPHMTLYFGGTLMVFGSVLCSLFYQMHKGRYYKIKMGLIKDSIIQEYVRNYWHGLFPKDSVEVILHANQTIEIITKRLIDTEETLEKIQRELGLVLVTKLGYKRDFILTIVLA